VTPKPPLEALSSAARSAFRRRPKRFPPPPEALSAAARSAFRRRPKRFPPPPEALSAALRQAAKPSCCASRRRALPRVPALPPRVSCGAGLQRPGQAHGELQLQLQALVRFSDPPITEDVAFDLVSVLDKNADGLIN
jgi:hypothetical protein